MTSYRTVYDVICAKNTRLPDRQEFVMFHIMMYIAMAKYTILKFMRKRLMLTVK